ncbi:MAG: hypothetical protein QOH53_1445, partial [Ilumatobacteraceae bacterium]
MKADEAVLVEVVGRHEVRWSMVDRRVQVMECHLSEKVELKPLRLR